MHTIHGNTGANFKAKAKSGAKDRGNALATGHHFRHLGSSKPTNPFSFSFSRHPRPFFRHFFFFSTPFLSRFASFPDIFLPSSLFLWFHLCFWGASFTFLPDRCDIELRILIRRRVRVSKP